MVVVREALKGELRGTAELGQFKLVSIEDGELTGCVACSLINRDAWLHDFEYWGEPDSEAPAILLRKAYRWIKRKGYAEFMCNVSASAENVIFMVAKAGGRAQQVIFKVDTKWRG